MRSIELRPKAQPGMPCRQSRYPATGAAAPRIRRGAPTALPTRSEVPLFGEAECWRSQTHPCTRYKAALGLPQVVKASLLP